MRQWRGVVIVNSDPAVWHIFLVAASWVLLTIIVTFVVSLVIGLVAALFGATEEAGPFNDQIEDLCRYRDSSLRFLPSRPRPRERRAPGRARLWARCATAAGCINGVAPNGLCDLVG